MFFIYLNKKAPRFLQGVLIAKEKPRETAAEKSLGVSAGIAAHALEKIRGFDRKTLAALLIIFLLGFGVRGFMAKYELFFEFDSYWHARMTSYVIQTGYEPQKDPLAYYQIGGSDVGSPGPVFWHLSAFIYKVVMLGAPYNKDALIVFVKLLPALYGALISVAMFFLGREMFGTKAGYAAAFFAAIVPSFVYRTMASFYEEDSLGFLWMVAGFYFFIKAVKHHELTKDSLKSIALSGMFFGILAWTWGMFLVVPLVIAAYLIWVLALMWFRGESRAAISSLAAMVVICFVIFGVIATLEPVDGASWINSAIEYVRQYMPITQENIERAQARGPGVLQQTIGEENLGHPYWGTKYNALIIFPYAAIFLGIWRVLRKKDDRVTMIMIFWVVLAMFMAWNKLKFTYGFGLPIALSAGFVFGELFEFTKGRISIEKKAVGVALAFMMLVGVGAGSYFVVQHFPNINMDNGWKQALYWAKDNTEPDAKFFNWWDEGHWISFIAERGASTDNRNFDFAADQDFARFILAEDENEAYGIVKGYGSDYVVLSADLLMKSGSMGMYAYNTTDFSDPRLRRYLGIVIPCSVEPSPEGTIHHCGGNTFSGAQITAIPDRWIAEPNNMGSDRVPLFIYRSTEKTHIFALNAAQNNTMLTRLWFSEPSIKHFEVVYSQPQIKILKVTH